MFNKCYLTGQKTKTLSMCNLKLNERDVLSNSSRVDPDRMSIGRQVQPKQMELANRKGC